MDLPSVSPSEKGFCVINKAFRPWSRLEKAEILVQPILVER